MASDPQSLPNEIIDAPPAEVSARQKHEPPANWRLGFWSLIVTQFQGAFNDNCLKFLVIYLIVDHDFPAIVRDQFVLLVGGAICSSIHFLFADWRLFCGPLQQAIGHDRNQVF